jgi:hypothetical protein
VNVCPDCFENDGLGRRIAQVRPKVSEGQCDEHPNRKGIPIEELAKIVDPVFRELYWPSADDGNHWRYNRGGDLIDTLYDLTGAIDDNISRALSSALVDLDDYWPPDGEEAFYDEEALYTLQDDESGLHLHDWKTFRRSLMFESRFFNPDAEQALGRIFDGIQRLRDSSGKGPIYLIQPGTPEAHFFRARIANSREEAKRIKAELSKELGPPPEQLRKAGRLNPSGISAFYGAFDLPTCIAELRPSVGGSVISAQFELKQPICVLDTTLFVDRPGAVNLFAAGALKRKRQWAFMQTFMEEIGQPVFPGDEHLQYLPTQAVAEFLNRRFKVKFAGERRAIDAVIFRSAQRPEGRNIVILGNAALVEVDAAKYPDEPGKLIGFKDDDDFEFWFENELESVRADKKPGLRVEPETVRWTQIDGVEFSRKKTVNDDLDGFGDVS